MRQSEFQFLNPYLTEIQFSVNPDFSTKSTNDNIEIQNTFSTKIKKSKEENRANVELTLESNKNNDTAPFKLKISVASDFKWNNLDEKTLDSMLSRNAPALLLSYMRPIVANITNSSKFPAYNLPFMNFKD